LQLYAGSGQIHSSNGNCMLFNGLGYYDLLGRILVFPDDGRESEPGIPSEHDSKK